jgi:hypothetical protein
MKLFRYLTVAQVEQNAITGQEISDKSNGLKPKTLFCDVNEPVIT